jgi:hypothetical protein
VVLGVGDAGRRGDQRLEVGVRRTATQRVELGGRKLEAVSQLDNRFATR